MFVTRVWGRFILFVYVMGAIDYSILNCANL